MSEALVEKLRGDELKSIENDVKTELRDQILKALDERGGAQELIRQEYTGRYPFELLQNANDAAAASGAGGAVLFEIADNALIVADQGAGFGEEQIRAICSLGRSSKDPRKSIGYKGLGFKSVEQITRKPQIASSGLCFGFDEERAREVIAEVAGALESSQRIPAYAFPFLLSQADFGPDADRVIALTEQGFRTILRLPFREGVSQEDVASTVRETITPRLLLFLDATDSIEVRGGPNGFRADAVRDPSGELVETLLQVGDRTEHWLVFRRAVGGLDRSLVDPLGEAWHNVEQVHVAVAFPLDEQGRPTRAGSEPLSVYFPTEEHTGLSVLLQADFALELDRRRIARTAEAQPYNEWLASQLGELARDAVEELATRFPGDARVVAAVAPVTQPTGFGEYVLERCLYQLLEARFVPVIGGDSRRPREAALLPASVPDVEAAHRLLNLEGHPTIVTWEVEADPKSRQLLAQALDTPEFDVDAALVLLTEPAPEDDEQFYSFLVAWAENDPRRFPTRLAEVACVRTLGGGWVSPSSGVFFPRERDDVVFPDGLRVPIISTPEVGGLRGLLESAGVRSFEWRQLIPEFVLPLLSETTESPDTRRAALGALRGYFETERSGDPRMHQQIRRALMPARRADGAGASLQEAGGLYFSQTWRGDDALECIYGPFETTEFLDIEPPDEPAEREADRAFYQWMGISWRPRIDERVADQRSVYGLNNLDRHPHRLYGQLWKRWQAEQLASAATCSQGHASYQQLRSSYALDRLVDLVATGDRTRLSLLWRELSEGWASYDHALSAEVSCNHGWHTGGQVRTVPSLLLFTLKELDWVPCIHGSDQAIESPQRVWRVAGDTPPRVMERVAVLDPHLDRPDSSALIATLGVVDAARPRPSDLVALLGALAESHGAQADGAEGSRDLILSARWAMRKLNDSLAGDAEGLTEPVPLLAVHDGRHVFHESPLIAMDPMLAETWEPILPILDADRDLRRLHDTLHLRVLDDEVVTRPDPRGPRPDDRLIAEAWVRDAAPYLAAVAIDQVPSRHEDVIRGLSRLEVAVCDDLVLRFELDGEVRERTEAVSYIAARVEQDRLVRRRIGTLHLELDQETNAPHWYSLGPQLAQFLGVPTLGDAFALILNSNRAARQQYLAARRISIAAVDEARLELDSPPADEEILERLLDIAAHEASQDGSPPPAVGASTDETNDGSATESEARVVVPMPALEHERIEVTDALQAAPGSAGTATTRHRTPSLGPMGPVDHERQQRLQRQIGIRGEEAAFEAEKRRLLALGFDPALVVWRSRTNEFAPYDIESLDIDGQQIYIEVKSTTSRDPDDPFEISEAELIFALSKRGSYYVYRVTDVQTSRPSITRYHDPIGQLQAGTARLRLSGARLTLMSARPDPREG